MSVPRIGVGWDPHADGAVDPFGGQAPVRWRSPLRVPMGVQRGHARFYDVVSWERRRDLMRAGVLERTGAACAVGPYASSIQVWRDYERRHPPLVDRAGFDLRRRTRIALHARGEPQPDWVLRSYIAVFGTEAIGARAVSATFGKEDASDVLRRLKMLAGMPVGVVRGKAGGDPLIGPRGGVRRLSPRPSKPAGSGRIDRRLYDAVHNAGLAKLRTLGAVSFERGRYRVDPNATCRDVWSAYERAADLGTGETFDAARRTRRLLGALAVPWSDRALRAYLEHEGAAGLDAVRVTSTFGKQVAADTLRRLRVIAGRPAGRRARAAPGTARGVLALIPPDLRTAFEGHLSRERHPPLAPMDELLAGRVVAMKPGPCRLLTALALIALTADRRRRQTCRQMVACGVRWAVLLTKVDLNDAPAINQALREHLAIGSGTCATDLTRLTDCTGWIRLTRLARGCARMVLGADADAILRLLPAMTAPDRGLAADLTDAKGRLLGVGRSGRVPVVRDVIARLMTIQAAIENRLIQLERIVASCAAALPGARNALEAGLEAGFQYEDVLLNADGTIGEGRQTVSFRFVLETTLLERALDADPGNRRVRARLDAAHRCGAAPDGARIHVVYDRTWSDDVAMEAVEPFFIELFRSCVLDTCTRLPDELATRQRALLEEIGLPRTFRVPAGLLGHPPEIRPIARIARGRRYEEGDILMPLSSFHHAMAMARIVVRYGIRWGARLGEIMQMRVGCAGRHRVDGVWKPYLALKPKGWSTEGRFGIDEGTVRLIAQLRAHSNARWHDGRRDHHGRPMLPVVPYGVPDRADLPPAAYLFQGPRRALNAGELALLTKILLSGIVDMRSHDGRYVFATALGLRGTGYDCLGGTLHHRRGSRMPAMYDLSALLGAGDAAERFSDENDARLMGMLASG